MKNLLRGIITAILIVGLLSTPYSNTNAATKYITKKDFIKELVIELKLKYSTDRSDSYLLAATEAGIIKPEDFNNEYEGYITRTDAAVLLNRADEYLHGDTVDAKLLDIVLKSRISDIKKVAKEKREAVAKCFAKGIIKGYSNGDFTTNREFRGNKYLTETAAKEYIKLLKNKSKRAKLSPDGQLIRTTNLPKYAKYYPYILASFPNKYYDWKFQYEDKVLYNPLTNKEYKFKYLTDYAPPVDVDKTTYFDNISEVKKEYLDTWVNKVRTFVECTFNVDYRTINNDWVNAMLSADYRYGEGAVEDQARASLKKYIADMKKNKTIVESAIVAVDGSSLFYYDNNYYLRVYVKYRINSSKVKYGADANTLIAENPYGKILYSNLPLVSLNSFSLGKWKETCFDVELTLYSQRSPEKLGVSYANICENYYELRRVDK
jgi:hypothetical protein